MIRDSGTATAYEVNWCNCDTCKDEKCKCPVCVNSRAVIERIEKKFPEQPCTEQMK